MILAVEPQDDGEETVFYRARHIGKALPTQEVMRLVQKTQTGQQQGVTKVAPVGCPV